MGRARAAYMRSVTPGLDDVGAVDVSSTGRPTVGVSA